MAGFKPQAYLIRELALRTRHSIVFVCWVDRWEDGRMDRRIGGGAKKKRINFMPPVLIHLLLSSQSKLFFNQRHFYFSFFFFKNHNFIVLGVHCDIYKSAYNVSYSLHHSPLCPSRFLVIALAGFIFPFSYMST
jgi:hypothetical protein